jgi:aminoglycoside phosphotransferase (APT) family kinase protein
MTSEEMTERLARFIARQVGAGQVVIDGLRRLPGGASRETWAFDAIYHQGGAAVRLPLVLRRDPGPAAVQTGRREEFLLLRAAQAARVPVPRVYWLGDETETLGARFFIMERVEGETLGRRLLRDRAYAPARDIMTWQLGEILARIHRIDSVQHGLDFLPQPPAGEPPAQAEIDRYEQVYRFVAPEPHPTFELAFRWLRERLPRVAARTVVHGDYRIGNVIFGPEGARAILDWELAHLGDPMEDLGWMCVRSWRFGNDDKPVGGLGERAEFFEAYERAGGQRVDPAQVRFWETFGNLKWAIICITQAKRYLDGHEPNVELASLGRRTAEVEWELLDLIGA